MRGNGNGVLTLLQKLYFMCLPTCKQRTNYIVRNKKLFHHVGENFFFQSRLFPSDPEYISFGDNVMISSDVTFINHDVIHNMLNRRLKKLSGSDDSSKDFKPYYGPIEIGNNVVVGSKTIILPNVRIGNNVIIGAGSIVTKDVPDNSVVGGVPAKVIGDFESIVKKREKVCWEETLTPDIIWDRFRKSRIKE